MTEERLVRASTHPFLAMAVLTLLAAPSYAQNLATLATAPGDGQVSVDVDAYGSFGYRTFDDGADPGDEGDAIYDPLGSPLQLSGQLRRVRRLSVK